MIDHTLLFVLLKLFVFYINNKYTVNNTKSYPICNISSKDLLRNKNLFGLKRLLLKDWTLDQTKKNSRNSWANRVQSEGGREMKKSRAVWIN